jgi:drug/metabolite transporter (DMT)-like permease
VVLSLVLAVLSAASNAASNVLQRMANREEPPERNLSPRLLVDLVQRKVWLSGLAATIAAFLLQAGALSQGALAVVQPLIVLELPLTLLGAKLALGAELHRLEWTATGLMTAGLAALIGFLDPREGTSRPSDLAWVVGGGASVVVIGVLVLAGRATTGVRRAALLGAATGITFGLTAAFTKTMTGNLSRGVAPLFSHWTTYSMVATGILGVFLMQSALHAGRLAAAQPGVTLLDPFTSIVWGVLAFHERTNSGIELALAAGGAAVMACGAGLLGRSPVLRQAQAESEGRADTP